MPEGMLRLPSAVSAMLLVLLVYTGCTKKAEPTPLQRKEAATLVSEAEFALAIRDYPRAEDLMRQATALCPDDGSYWMTLGNLTKRNDKRADARQAYAQAAEAYAAAYKKAPTNSKLLLQQMYAEALLGHSDKARALIKKAREKHPQDAGLQAFDDAALDRMLSNPSFKELAL